MPTLKRPRLSALRRKGVVLPTVAAAAVLGVGGTVWAATADDTVEGADRDRVAAAAVAAVGSGEAVDVETSDDAGEAYEVEVRLPDGSEVEVTLDADLTVLGQDADGDRDDADEDDADEDDTDDRGDAADRDDAADRALDAAERDAAGRAALDAVGGGTVLDVEAGDDPGEAYEVDVRDRDGVEWDVELDEGYEVLRKRAGR